MADKEMADQGKPAEAAPKTSNERPKYAPTGPRGGPMGGGNRGTGEKAVNFLPSLRRLALHLKDEIPKIAVVLVTVILATGAQAVGPKILGNATDIIFDAVQAGRSIDFAAVGEQLLIATGLYLASGLMMWATGLMINGIVQRSVYRMRRQVADKITRLPLKYFDSQPRGELLSRVTNDMDNISQSMQQTLSQLLTNLFTIIGVLIMMFYLSWILALVALLTIPVAVAVTMVIGKRSQRLFAATWKNTGQLNAQIEEAFTGQDLVKVFGRQREIAESFREKNAELFGASFGAQFISGIIMPVMFFVGNLNYVVI
ncbi:MAG: ABC transporter ATP-binding protein, partial [Propionibacteriaceae bacterium]|nr:ABC transporter ATP-binding protein [Propionibacteriaceae bacterium]